MIEIKKVSKSFNKKIVFKNLNLSFEKDKLNILTGTSGCGKTTLFNIISGIDTDFEGEINGIPDEKSYLFQEDRLLSHFTAIENITFILPDTYNKNKKNEIAKMHLNNLCLEKDYNTYPNQLSGGMSRRVAIARSFAFTSKLLLLDEPFNGLNIELKHIVIKEIINKLKNKNQYVILISHDTSLFDNFESKNIIDMNNIIL